MLRGRRLIARPRIPGVITNMTGEKGVGYVCYGILQCQTPLGILCSRLRGGRQ